MTKTAMMQLREKLINKINNTSRAESFATLYSVIDIIDSQMLEVERDQICEAFGKGYLFDSLDVNDYYTQTFTQNKNG